MALDAHGRIWTFLCWGRPFRLTTPLLDNSTINATPKQVECGWVFSAALTESGDVFVWWPFEQGMTQAYATRMHEMNAEGGKDARATRDGVIPCVTWDMPHNPIRLPALPRLPTLSHPDGYGNDDDDSRVETKFVKIAAMDHHLIGLTNKGHVLKFDNLHNGDILRAEGMQAQRQWIYVSFLMSLFHMH